MTTFTNITAITGPDNQDCKYVILESYPEIHYTLIARNAKYQPFVVAYRYNAEGGYWAQGHYFHTLLEATDFIKNELENVA